MCLPSRGWWNVLEPITGRIIWKSLNRLPAVSCVAWKLCLIRSLKSCLKRVTVILVFEMNTEVLQFSHSVLKTTGNGSSLVLIGELCNARQPWERSSQTISKSLWPQSWQRSPYDITEGQPQALGVRRTPSRRWWERQSSLTRLWAVTRRQFPFRTKKSWVIPRIQYIRPFQPLLKAGHELEAQGRGQTSVLGNRRTNARFTHT